MKKCKFCQNDIDSNAKICPNCHKDQRIFFERHLVLTIILGLVLIAAIGSAIGGSEETSKKTSTKQEQKIIEYTKIDIDELETALKNNAAAAKDTYKGKYLEITGRLGTIDSDLKYISLLSTTDSWDIIGVHCSIKNSKTKDIVKTLSKDQTIIVKGKITDVGEVLGYYLDIDEIIAQ
ncbi:MAG: hypothetical protein IKO49_02780 [Bacilli bacterium]|nr:hypothetical protein [Bacilli bacterium]